MTNKNNDDSFKNSQPDFDSPLTQKRKLISFADLSVKTRAILALGFGALLAIAYYTSSLRSPELATKSNLYELDPSQVEKRQILPDYLFHDAHSMTHKLSDFHGQVLILSFWASWCSPCLVELPTFAQMQKRLKNKGLNILAVNVEDGDEGKKFAEDFWSRNKFDFMSFFDSTKELAESFQVDLLPSNFVIDKSGRLAFSGFGSTDWSSPQIVELIEGLLQESASEISNRPELPKKPVLAAPAKPGQSEKNEEKEEEDVD